MVHAKTTIVAPIYYDVNPVAAFQASNATKELQPQMELRYCRLTVEHLFSLLLLIYGLFFDICSDNIVHDHHLVSLVNS